MSFIKDSYTTNKVSFLAIILTLCVNIGNAQSVEYNELTLQEQADFSRWLGWVWGDGLPLDEDNLTGIRYTGPNASNFDDRYKAVIDRLRASQLGLVLNGTNRRQILEPWDYWTNAIPGGNSDDPQLLRDAVRNPNFLAGIIDTEGGNCGTTNNIYYIDDHTYSPFHPDTDRGWGLLNFGPYRMVELFHLIGGTYGFEKTTMQIGVNGTRYMYGHELERDSAIMDVLNGYNNTAAHNMDVLLNGGSGRSMRVRVYIDSDDWDTFRSYGYWNNPSRYPDCNNSVVSNDGTFPLSDLPLAGSPTDECDLVSVSDLEEPNVLWFLATSGEADATLTTTNGLAEIDIHSPGAQVWNVSLRHQDVALEEGQSYHISFDAYAEDDRPITVIANKSDASVGYFFRTHEITTVPTRYTHEFTMNDTTDLNALMRINVGNQLTHKVFFENIRLVEAECVCPEERVFVRDINNATAHFESSEHIVGSNVIDGTSSITYDAGVFVELNANFEVKAGSIFYAYIDGCGGI